MRYKSQSLTEIPYLYKLGCATDVKELAMPLGLFSILPQIKTTACVLAQLAELWCSLIVMFHNYFVLKNFLTPSCLVFVRFVSAAIW